MKRAVKWLRRSAFGLGIAVALAFGGYQAFAGPTTAMAPCDWVPPDFGPCSSPYECQARCDNYYGPGTAQGLCETVWPPQEPPNDKCCLCVVL
jgi:hypothetical protein